MATTTRTRVDGLRELGQNMVELGVDIVKASRASTYAGAKLVKDAAKRNVEASPSVDEGDLLRAVIVKREGRTNLTSEHLVTVRGRGKPYNKKGQRVARAPHAHFVEFGTVNMPAEPFLRPALERNQDAAIERMKRPLEQRINKARKVASKAAAR